MLDSKGVESANFLYLLSLVRKCMNCKSYMTISLLGRALSSACNEMNEDLW